MEKQLIPELRFPYYNDDWDKVVLEKITTKISDGIHSTPNYDLNGEYYFVNGNNLVNGSISINENTKKVSLEEFKKHKRPLSKNSILLSINGTIGNLALYNNENIVLGKSACYINLQKDLPIDFYYYILQTPKIKKYFLSELTGSTIMNLSLRTIKATKLIVPSLTEQQKIASFLTDVDGKITKLTKKKELLEQYKKGVMQNIFNQELRFKDDNGNEFPLWQKNKLGKSVKFLKGKGLPKSEIVCDGQYKCIHYGELFTKYNELIDNIISRTNDNDRTILSKVNDVLMPTSDVTPNGLATASCIKESDVILGGDVLIIRQDIKKIEGVYLAYYIKHFRNDVMKLVSGSTVYHLYGSDMKNLQVLIPCLDEQIKIANFLTDIDLKITVLNTKIESNQTFKKGLLQKMFV